MIGENGTPGQDLIGAEAYSRAFTSHGSILMFLWLMPAVAGLTHAMLEKVHGITRSAIPWLSGVGFWLVPLGGLLMLVSFFFGGGAGGWTGYLPLSARLQGFGQTLWLASLAVLVLSVACNATSFLASVLRSPRPPDRGFPAFVVATLASSGLALIASPVLLAAAAALLVDRLLPGPSLLQGTLGPTLWQHAFWFFAHPATSVVLLPALGAVCEIVQTSTGRPLVGRRSVSIALVAVGGLALVSWGQHMLVSGLIDPARVAFMLTSMGVAVPTGYIVLSWIATLWVSRARFDTPLVFALGFTSVLMLAGLSGLMLAAVPVNQQLHDTYFVLGHSHLGLFGVVTSGLIAGIYYVFPGLTGKTYDDTLGKVHSLVHFGGVHMAFLPMFLLGLFGTPRRVIGIGAEFEPLVLAMGAGAMASAVASLMFLYNLFFAWRMRRPTVQSGSAAPGR